MPGSLSTAVNNTVDGSAVANSLESERAATDLWTRAIHRLKGRLSRHTFQTYFEPIKPVSLEGDELTLAHSSRFMIDWVRDNLLDVLLQDLEAQLGRLRTSSRWPPAPRSPTLRARPTTHCSSTAAWDWARRTSCTPSATTRCGRTPTATSSTCRRSRSPTT
ncbi:MAG: hypothetical protein E6J84_11030 [Deltaproteobacteria bacterium]|nr:MAG: hypothetical protein E6J84_11030 [Deltaproteobacteria bacterium]